MATMLVGWKFCTMAPGALSATDFGPLLMLQWLVGKSAMKCSGILLWESSLMSELLANSQRPEFF